LQKYVNRCPVIKTQCRTFMASEFFFNVL
jgi:hypothetical protein